MMRAADPACDYLERHLPAKWQRSLARYASGAGPESRHNTWLQLLRRMMLPGALYLVFCIFAEAAFLRYAAPWIEARIPGRTGAAVSLAAILAVLAPILLVVLRQGNRSPNSDEHLWNDSKFNRGPLVSLILIKCLLCIGILMTVVASLFDTASGMGFAVSLALLTGIVFSKRLRRRSFEMEERLRAEELRRRRHSRCRTACRRLKFSRRRISISGETAAGSSGRQASYLAAPMQSRHFDREWQTKRPAVGNCCPRLCREFGASGTLPGWLGRDRRQPRRRSPPNFHRSRLGPAARGPLGKYRKGTR